MNPGILSLPYQSFKPSRGLLGRASPTPMPYSLSRNDPYWNNVALLVKFDGISGSQNYIDYSQYNHKITPYGTINISSDQSNLGESSGYFGRDGNSGLSINDHPAFALGTNNFTIEAWVYTTDPSLTNTIIGQRTDSAEQQLAFVLYVLNNKSHLVVSNNGTSWQINSTGSVTVSANTWTHIAIVRNSTRIAMYVNGVLALNALFGSGSVFDSTAPLWIGHSYTLSNQDFLGYIGELRYTTRIARYTSAFTPLKESFPTF